jgi:single-strand DNA-binding protein
MDKRISMGRVVRDAETKTLNGTNGAFNITTFDLAVMGKGKEQETTWINNIEVRGPMAETAAKYFKQGKGLIVTMEITTRSFTDKEGNKRKVEDHRLSDYQFLPDAKPVAAEGGAPAADAEDDAAPF